MKEVYVVMCRTGEYDCEYTRPVLVVNTKQEAEEEVLRLNNLTGNYDEASSWYYYELCEFKGES